MLFRSRTIVFVVALTLALWFFWGKQVPSYGNDRPHSGNGNAAVVDSSEWQTPGYFWTAIKHEYPLSPRPLPSSPVQTFPKVQAAFPKLASDVRDLRAKRQQAIKDAFTRCWASYKTYAWGSDELSPVSAGKKNPFGGWAATLVDSLDTLWIMGMKSEFNEAVTAVESIDFTGSSLEKVNIFETTIRYLGGFLAAYDLSGDKRLLRKAVQVGDMIYKAFDTPNHLPITRWDFQAAARGGKQEADSFVLVAEIGSLCMELTRLSQVTGDPKWFDASQRVMDLLASAQDSTSLPGEWPLVIDAKSNIFNQGDTFTLGAMADSVYEYMPKMAALLGGQLPAYRWMYEKSMNTALKYNLFRPMTPSDADILVSGQIKTKEDTLQHELEPQGQHLVCFLGGVLALGGRLFSRQRDVEAAAKLTKGCIYAYKAFPHGIMPETFYMLPCESRFTCKWNEDLWRKEVLAQAKETDATKADSIIDKERLPKGFTRIPDRRYILRPEAIESIFYMYRVTADEDWADEAWDMFTAIQAATQTELANTAVSDVTVEGEKPQAMDSMESFWMGETLKYFYLVFSDPGLISLDEWVFNTEAHPLRRLLA